MAIYHQTKNPRHMAFCSSLTKPSGLCCRSLAATRSRSAAFQRPLRRGKRDVETSGKRGKFWVYEEKHVFITEKVEQISLLIKNIMFMNTMFMQKKHVFVTQLVSWLKELCWKTRCLWRKTYVYGKISLLIINTMFVNTMLMKKNICLWQMVTWLKTLCF